VSPAESWGVREDLEVEVVLGGFVLVLVLVFVLVLGLVKEEEIGFVFFVVVLVDFLAVEVFDFLVEVLCLVDLVVGVGEVLVDLGAVF
jgi:hypothetical protein